MKRNNKKGFTIVELVIVIAVIAILAAVLIPTFGGVIKTAEKNALMQEAAATYKEVYAIDLSDGKLDGKENGTAISLTAYENTDVTDVTYTVTEATGAFTFTYVGTKYTASFSGTTWSVTETPAAG